jgi:pimeloyl-ACP methyl ester carboxylesterase
VPGYRLRENERGRGDALRATETVTARITEREAGQVDRANSSGRTPVVFIHGLWALPNNWERWVGPFEDAGYVVLTPGWPDDPETVRAAREQPEAFARKTIGDLADHFTEITGRLERRPALVGHSFGGMLTQILAGRGLASVSVAISPAPFRGVVPMPFSLVRSVLPVLCNPVNRRRAVPLSYRQFRYSVSNTTDELEARELWEAYEVPAGGRALFQAAFANLNPWTEAKVNTRNPARGPLLLVSGGKDRFIPPAITKASYKRERRNDVVTEFVEIPGRGHSLTIDSGWREVAEVALGFIRRFAPPSADEGAP